MSKVAFFLWALMLFSVLATQPSFACDGVSQSDTSGGSCKTSDCAFSCGGGSFGGIIGINILPFTILPRVHGKTIPDIITTQPNWGLVMFDTRGERAIYKEGTAYLDVQRGMA